MKYFKNTELAKLYHVSEKSVRNWVDAAKQGKLDLQLYSLEGRSYIANTSANEAMVKELVKKGEKYKNTRSYEVVTPTADFYRLYSSKQIFEIISSLNIRRELPLQYNYLDIGAKEWDMYTSRLAEEKVSNMLLTCKRLLETNLDSIDRLVEGHQKVNLIDIGIGNCMPVRGIINHFLKKGSLNRYVGLDISNSMLTIARHNLEAWFGKNDAFEFYARDITHDEFGDLLAYDYFGKEEDAPLNIIMLLGGTIANFEVPDDILRTINRSMQPSDLFICSLKLDTPNSRRYFDLDADPAKSRQVANWHRLILDLLNINESLYEVEQVFDEKKKARYIGVRLKKDISIKFIINEVEYVIRLHKGETVLLLRYWHQSAADVTHLLNKNGFEMLQASKSKDHEYLLTVSEAAATKAISN